ncbi:MAG: hypothetical protein KC800_22320 [Candidatus Eremiobacteraeota bacterium]|nr:hypothetical protein [Candidatus Eremiobacteraeota bacterium]
MQPIDPVLVKLIDSVDLGKPNRQSAERWLRSSAEYRTTIGLSSDYSLNEKEAERLAELPGLLAELDRCVEASLQGGCDAETLLSASLRFFTRYSEMVADREETFFVEIPVFDQLLCAGKAILEGRAKPAAVTTRVEGCKRERDRLKALFEPHSQSFPEEFQRSMEEGFSYLSEGFDLLDTYTQTPSNETLDQALTKMNRGAQMVAVFPTTVREMQREHRRHIPLIGSLLETLEVDPTEEYLNLLRDEGLPELRHLWEEKDDGWLLPPEEAEPLLEEVSSAIDELEDALPDFHSNPEAFWKTVDRLEDGFKEIRANSMPVQNVLDSSLGPEAALLLALLEGKAPDHAAKTAVQAMRAGDVPDFISELADGLEDYLDSKDKIVLLELLQLLLEQV